jgi:uncharacterized delta-60 repeat protein
VAAGYSGGSGRSFDFAVARYNVDGTLDTTFGAGGATTTDFFSWRDFPYAVAIRPDGKIVVAGNTGTVADRQRRQFALARYNADGSLDGSFDGDGKVATQFAPGSDDGAQDLVLQPDGKIIVAGDGTAAGTHDVALARYNADGSLDPTFDGDGRVLTPIEPGRHEGAWAVALQGDGKIVAAGGFGLLYNAFVLLRYHPNGSLDATFAGDGIVDVHRTAMAAWDVAIQRDGRIVVVGAGNFAVHRFTSDGRLDASFGGGRGTVEADFGPSETAWAVALQRDGRIVAVGEAGDTSKDFAVARFHAQSPTCLVPRVRGRTLAAARRALRQARCSLGRVVRQRSRVRKGLVISQRPAPGTVLPEGGSVRVVVSLGRRSRSA